jgi:hypothetical protein
MLFEADSSYRRDGERTSSSLDRNTYWCMLLWAKEMRKDSLWEGGTSMGISDKATPSIGTGSSPSTCRGKDLQSALARRSSEYGQDVHPAGYGWMRQSDANLHCHKGNRGNGRSNGGQEEVKHDNQVGWVTILLVHLSTFNDRNKRTRRVSNNKRHWHAG